MLICIDLSALYFAIRELSITINYESFLRELRKKFGEDASIHCFTIAASKNVSQQKFLQKLQQLGVELHVYPSNTPPVFTAEICTWAANSDAKSVVFVTNDWNMIRSFDMLESFGKELTLSFFSEKLQGPWIPRVMSGKTRFYDLSDSEVSSKIAE